MLFCQVFPQRIFPIGQLLQGIFPSSNLPTVQFTKPQSVLAAVLGPPPHCRLRRIRGRNLTFGKLPLGKLKNLSFGKLSLGKSFYGKCLLEKQLRLFCLVHCLLVWRRKYTPLVLGITLKKTNKSNQKKKKNYLIFSFVFLYA